MIGRRMQSIGLLNQSSCARNQIKPEVLNETFPKLVDLVDKKDLKEPVTDEDKTIGFEIFHAIVFCPSSLSMDFKLYQFVDSLLSNESQRTIIQSYVNLFRSGMVKEVGRMASMKKFYDVHQVQPGVWKCSSCNFKKRGSWDYDHQWLAIFHQSYWSSKNLHLKHGMQRDQGNHTKLRCLRRSVR